MNNFKRYRYNPNRGCLTAIIRFWIKVGASPEEVVYRYHILQECIERLLTFDWFRNILIMIPRDEKFGIACDRGDTFTTMNNLYRNKENVSVQFATNHGLYTQGLLNRAISIQERKNGSTHALIISPENYEYFSAIPELIEALKQGCLVAEIGLNEIISEIRQGFPSNSLTGWNVEALMANGLFGGLTNPQAMVHGYHGVGGEGACAVAGLAKEYGPCMGLIDPPANARRQIFNKTTEVARVETKVARAKTALAQSGLSLPSPEKIFVNL